jgi:hypothetical protein
VYRLKLNGSFSTPHPEKERCQPHYTRLKPEWVHHQKKVLYSASQRKEEEGVSLTVCKLKFEWPRKKNKVSSAQKEEREDDNSL